MWQPVKRLCRRLVGRPEPADVAGSGGQGGGCSHRPPLAPSPSCACPGASLQSLPAEVESRLWDLLDLQDQRALAAAGRQFRWLWLARPPAEQHCSAALYVGGTCSRGRGRGRGQPPGWRPPQPGNRQRARCSGCFALPPAPGPAPHSVWRSQAASAAAERLVERVSCQLLLRDLQPGDHPLLVEQYIQSCARLYLSEKLLCYLCRQEPEFLQTELGPAFGRALASCVVDKVNDIINEDLRPAPVLFGLVLIHHRAPLSEVELELLEALVRDVPCRLVAAQAGGCNGDYDCVEGCCHVQGPVGRRPLFWQVDHCRLFHGEHLVNGGLWC